MRPPRPAWAVLCASLVLGAGAAAEGADGPAASRNNEGNRLYEARQYDEALRMYTDAQARLPDAPELHYNIGNVLYRKQQFDKAEEEYRRAEGSPNRALAQAAVYNRGNALLMQGRLPEAVQAYIQALRARPDDADAKRNLELALRRLEQQKQEQQPQPKDGGQDDKKPPQPSPSENQPSDPQGAKKPPPKPGQMSEEEARRLLEALQEQEQEGIKKHVSASVPRRRDPEKDW